MGQHPCNECGFAFDITLDRCPHCARPGLFPNVRLASIESERSALERRYRKAAADAEHRGCGALLHRFTVAMERTVAVIARSPEETLRLASGEHQVYATYHQLTEIEFRLPDGEKWDRLRTLTDQTLFGGYMKEVRFAALSVDGLGLSSYGTCSWVLRDDMVAHRASVFEENSVVFMQRHGVRIADANEPPPGYRAPWDERAKLCVAKLASALTADTGEDAFPGLLLLQGARSEKDSFVEVHIGGPITVRTLERVIWTGEDRASVTVRALHERLARSGVRWEEGPWKH